MEYKELIIIYKNNPDSNDLLKDGTYSLKFYDCRLIIKENVFIVESDGDDSSTVGEVFPIKSIIKYKGIK